ncbi:ubiquinone biosynthesis accessory factor UbiJ [Salinicola aestuarinus]|uniref:ubiquinone biosynthesis accessory factor UbiJ n=1 Tax=Salinicola aestuarinus TaxID=1949082 RepID=UPI00130097AD|nr:SCP2 sterol-binding domain-containing protein [Salinicola aestuarinus]
MLDTFALVALERALTRLLARDPATPKRLETLAGKTLRVEIESPGITLRVAFHETGLTLMRIRDWEGEDDLRITLTQHALERLAAGDSLERLLFSGTLPVAGDTGMLPAIQALFLDLDLDWEGALAGGVGNDGAHAVALAVRNLTRQARTLGDAFQHDVREYLFEESRWLPGQDQLEVARDQLGELKQRLDRLEARANRLERVSARAPRAQEPRP